MKRLLVGFFFITLTSGAHAVIVFNTLGPGDTYSFNTAYGVTGSSIQLGPFEQASQFTAQASGPLSEVDIGLTSDSLPNSVGGPVDVYITPDANGFPDNSSEILLGSVTPTHIYGSTNNSLVSVTSLNYSVTAGETYWLVLKPGSSTTNDMWNLSQPAVAGMVDFSKDDSHWSNNGIGVLGAFRIEAVPEPTTWALLGACSLILGCSALREGAIRQLRKLGMWRRST